MIPADAPVQRPRDARLLVIDGAGRMIDAARSQLLDFLRPDDLVIANDAATLPASLHGTHVPTGAAIEVRLAGFPPVRERLHAGGAGARGAHGAAPWLRLRPARLDVSRFVAIVFGAGDFRLRTEDRPPPPPLRSGDRLALGPLAATVERVLGHPRLVLLHFHGAPDHVWAGLARHGRPVQYAHVPIPLELWHVWTPIAAGPFAFEPPSAGFSLDWVTIQRMRARGIAFATITHAAGLSSTGDAELDVRLPFDEPYRIPHVTAAAVDRARAAGARVVAVGTTVVRALEHAGRDGRLRPGDGVATQRIGPGPLRIVSAILSGTHEPGSSHYQLLRAFLDDGTLERASAHLDSLRYRTHEFGDSVLIERARGAHDSARLPAATWAGTAPAA
jgi:S-adenosylmethionine:tRNA ribosyltransferase-isomerase